MIDPGSEVPRYRQVAESIRERLDRGEWEPGTHLPSETYLASEYGVGRDTMRDALYALQHEGLLVLVAGKRPMVPPATPLELLHLVRSARMIVRMPTYDERRELGIGVGIPVADVEWGRPAERRRKLYPGNRFAFTVE